MAITIQQDPTSPNIVNSDLLYVCTSNKTSEAQMQFVCDIKDGNNTLIQRIKQQPNPSNKAVFNVGQIMTGYFSNADRIWETSVVAPNTGSGLDFNVVFGEEYADSVSSSVELYDGIQNATTGSPALSGSDYRFNLYGGLNELQLANWNWQSGSKYDEEDATDDIVYSHQNGLTFFNTQSVEVGDYSTISFLNGNLNGAPNAVNAQNVFAALYQFYDANGTQFGGDQYIYNETIYGSSPLLSGWGDVYTSQSEATRLVHFPTGPQNIVDAGFPQVTASAYYEVTFVQQATDLQPSDFGVFGKYRFNIGECSGFTPLRFAWKNQYGVWDYFNFTKANNRTSTIERKEYTQTFVDYSTSTNSVSYDQTRRGRVNHYNEVTKQRVANTDWLTQSDANNLREIFFSADVYHYDDLYGWVPVVITTANITEKTNDLAQKVFQYQMVFEYAVGQRPRQ